MKTKPDLVCIIAAGALDGIQGLRDLLAIAALGVSRSGSHMYTTALPRESAGCCLAASRLVALNAPG